MELIKKERAWFLSEEGGKSFTALSSLEERAIFIYSYLKSAVNEGFEKENTLFKIAFFFADAVYCSNKPYSQYPAILNFQSNPFLRYLENADKYYGKEITYMIFTAILQGKADPTNQGEWIYNHEFLNSETLFEDLLEKGIEYLPANSMDMVNPKAYQMEDSDKFLQLELVWIFLK